jgi:hypothetical protein
MIAPQILLEDDFRPGTDLRNNWAITRFPPRFSADDGIVSTSDRGLYVKAAGTNSETGEPAFSETAAGEDDHLKWMIDTQHLSSNSVPGFDAVPGHELQISMRARGRTFGTAAHPFGSAVTNPDTDLRLASFAMNTIDYETGMVFDIWMTNNAIYPYRRHRALTRQRRGGRSRQQDRLSGTGRDDDHRSWRNSGSDRAAAAELRDGNVHLARRRVGARRDRTCIPRAAVCLPHRVRRRPEPFRPRRRAAS